MFWLLRGLGILLLVVVLIDSVASRSIDAAGFAGGFLAVFGVPWLLAKRASDRCWRLLGTPGTYTVSDWGIQRSSALAQHGYAWSALRHIHEIPGQMIFTSRSAGFLPMPTAALLPGEREHILATAARNGVGLR
ncbi:hypothetical protein Aph02nite_24530 [Actinoplanes philippinensis]|uniref:YcxB-like protein n=1 Tax=Actinoplanes philippinensis TaxID=35752 RepID=A0A1I2G1T1_9ACTN|nr:hypothetical protein Aph02nite_24530 [Actinoplanes philippinensis]SFF11079.1 hypothetical protein SAMN05421541_106112 [Actinoplanes philippinensis]